MIGISLSLPGVAALNKGGGVVNALRSAASGQTLRSVVDNRPLMRAA